MDVIADTVVCAVAQTAERTDLGVIDGNARKKRRTSRFGCKQCDVAICNDQDCWDFYHRRFLYED